ncbi:MAG: Rrf2 family transcriptional regulator [Candidatus Hydrogenedentes bacterium]|nr:Rrf2 family transcriptional regulator [Candidatus Hydrogenedentota bacterium]
MFRLYSKRCEHAIRALTHLRRDNGAKRFKAKTLCRRAHVPESSTRKVFQELVAKGFLVATRGPGGGYELKRKPSDISLLNLIRVVDGETAYGDCVLGLPECNASMPCPLHHVWLEAREELLQQLESTTLEQLMEARELRAKKRKRK